MVPCYESASQFVHLILNEPECLLSVFLKFLLKIFNFFQKEYDLTNLLYERYLQKSIEKKSSSYSKLTKFEKVSKNHFFIKKKIIFSILDKNFGFMHSFAFQGNLGNPSFFRVDRLFQLWGSLFPDRFFHETPGKLLTATHLRFKGKTRFLSFTRGYEYSIAQWRGNAYFSQKFSWIWGGFC